MSTPTIRRAAEGGFVLELWLTDSEALRLSETIRELTGHWKPPAKPEAWVPLKDRPTTPPVLAPSIPPDLRERLRLAPRCDGKTASTGERGE